MWGLSIFLFYLVISTTWAAEWDAYNFPNPTAGQFKECNMRTTANICDPDGVLSEQARYRLDHDLKQLESRTRQEYGRSFCDKKGVTAAMAIARHVKGGTTEAVETMANDMLRKWTLDSQCKKAVVIVVSTDDMKFWVARDDKVPVYADEFTQMFMAQKTNFQESNYQAALSNILQATWEKSLSKQGSPRQPASPGSGGGGGRNTPQGPGTFGGGGSGGSGTKGMGMPSFKIPSWFWLLLIGVIIPLLCCCCCLYCCCCRSKGSGQQRVPTDVPAGGGGVPPQPRAGGGGGRSPFSNFLSTAGGAGVGSMLGRLLSGGGNRGGGMGGGNQGFGMGGGGGGGGGNRGYGYNGGGYAGGGAYPDSPTYDDNNGQGGGGLYPSREVKDRGGGGSWA